VDPSSVFDTYSNLDSSGQPAILPLKDKSKPIFADGFQIFTMDQLNAAFQSAQKLKLGAENGALEFSKTPFKVPVLDPNFKAPAKAPMIVQTRTRQVMDVSPGNPVFVNALALCFYTAPGQSACDIDTTNENCVFDSNFNPGTLDTNSKKMIAKLNYLRALNGLPPVVRDYGLSVMALDRAREIYEAGGAFSKGKDGEPTERAKGYGFSFEGQGVTELVAKNHLFSFAVYGGTNLINGGIDLISGHFEDWLRDPEAREVLLNPNINIAGGAVFGVGSTNRPIYVLELSFDPRGVAVSEYYAPAFVYPPAQKNMERMISNGDLFLRSGGVPDQF